MNASPRTLGLFATVALVAASLLVPMPTRADTTADISTFLTTGLADAPTDFAAMRGKPIPKRKDEYWSTADMGAFQRCMVIDMPSLDSLFSGTDSSDESDLECTSPRIAMSQKALLAWATATIGQDLGTGYKITRYLAKKPGDRASIHWASGPTSVQLIVSGNADALKHDYAHNYFYLSIAHTHGNSDGSN
jgi:hypothetical protein